MNLISSVPQRLKAYRRAIGLVTRSRGLFAAVMVASVLAAMSSGLGIGILIPLLQSPGTGPVSPSGSHLLNGLYSLIAQMPLTQRIRFVALTLLGITVAEAGFSYLGNLLSSVMQIRLLNELRTAAFRQLLGVEIRFVYKQDTGNLFTILTQYSMTVGQMVATLGPAAQSLFTVIVFIGIMLVVSWQLTLLAVLWLGILSSLIRGRLGRMIKRAAVKVNQASVELHSMTLEALSAMKLIRLAGKEETFDRLFGQAEKEFERQLLRRKSIDSLSKPLFQAINTFSLSLLLFASTIFLPSSTQIQPWLGAMVPFIIIIFRLIDPAAAVNSARIKIEQAEPDLAALEQLIARGDKPYLVDGQRSFSGLMQGIEFRDVSFGYEKDEGEVLHDVSFRIPKSKMTALVGTSGAGKTTVVDLLVRLYDAQRGQILVDDVDLRELRLRDWQSAIAVVSQDTFLFSDSVRSNLCFLKESASEDEIILAARMAHAHDFITELPNGYETQLGERGVRLSAGERQRIAIARAILSERPILVLDEATSNLDSSSESLIQTAIGNLVQDRTVLAVAHRLSTIRHADNILVIEKGRVVEQGTHDALIAQGGVYARFVRMQSLETSPPSPEPHGK
jgi:subfamily B ATP-binding cassette protein MsbA